MYRWYHPYHYYQHNPAYRNYPPVDTSVLEASVTEGQTLLQQSQVLLSALEDREFAWQVIHAAQQGQQQQVDQLIQTISDFTARTRVSYTPTGIRVHLSLPRDVEHPDCCSLSIELQWGK